MSKNSTVIMNESFASVPMYSCQSKKMKKWKGRMILPWHIDDDILFKMRQKFDCWNSFGDFHF